MFILFLVIALIGGAVLLALHARERVEGLVLVDNATGAVVLEGWDILLQHSMIVGILATVVFLLALAIGFSASELHIQLALRIRREWLDRKYRDDQLGVARDDCRRLQRQLEDAQRQLVAVKGQRADFRRKLRRVTRERDHALKATRRSAAAGMRGTSVQPPRPKHRRETPLAPRRCGTDLKVASHSVGAGLPPYRAASRAQPFRAPVCHAFERSVESGPYLKTGPLRGTSDAGNCDPDMVSSTRQNNGEMFRKERAIQARAAGDPAARVESTQPPG